MRQSYRPYIQYVRWVTPNKGIVLSSAVDLLDAIDSKRSLKTNSRMVGEVHSDWWRRAKAVCKCKRIGPAAAIDCIVTKCFGTISRSDVIIAIACVDDIIAP